MPPRPPRPASPAAAAQTTPNPGKISVIKVATEAVAQVSELEQTMLEEEWLPSSWTAKNGAAIRDRRDGMVLLHRGWNSVMETTIGKHGDLSTLRSALLELASASLKVAADIDGYHAARAALATDLDCDACGVVPVERPGGAKEAPEDDAIESAEDEE